ncbi:MAG: hypothetical protein MJZ41_07495 [Bacteroidaceae bacterium]|nr:hypothetical protein [Bacteroidaceae bacterium]
MKKVVAVSLMLTILFILGYFAGVNSCSADQETRCSVDTVYDTIAVIKPVPKDSLVVRYSHIRVPVNDTISVHDTLTMTDSTTIALPITQKHYKDSLYEAYVSGYEPNLDSIFINRPTITITNTRIKVHRLGVGLQGGYGITPKGFQPYIGVGLHYTLYPP